MSTQTIKQLVFVGLLAGLALTALIVIPVYAAAPSFILKWGSPGTDNGQFNNPGGVAVSGTAVYVADSYNHRIQKFTVDSITATFVISWGTTGITGTAQGQFDTPSAIAIDNVGDVYVADTNNHRIQKFHSDGSNSTQWGSLGAGDGQFNSPSGIAISGTYVYVADSKNNRIQVFDLVGTPVFSWGVGGNGNGEFNNPVGIAVDSVGYVYVADSDNNRIQKFDSSGAFVTTWGVTGTSLGQFTRPTGLTVDSTGNVYVVDTGNNRIQMFDSKGNFIATWGEYGGGDGQFMLVSGITVDSAGNTYLADTGNNRIQEFGPWSPTPSTSPTHSALQLMQVITRSSVISPFNNPTDVALDGAGNVYVADRGNNRVVKFDSQGAFVAAWTGAGLNPSWFSGPASIAVSGTQVYVADHDNNRVQVVDTNGGYITSLPIPSPLAIALDSGGNVYAIDDSSNQVYKCDSSGVFVTQWGSFTGTSDIAVNTAGEVFVTDYHVIQKFTNSGGFLAQFGKVGLGSGEFIDHPAGLAIDRGGNIYVADYGTADYHGRVQQFSSDHTYLSTIDTYQLGGSDTFHYPRGMAMARDGNLLYVADTGHNRIVKFGLASPPDYRFSFGEYGAGDGQFNRPGGIAVDNPLSDLSVSDVGAAATNYVYVADTLNRRVQKFTTGGAYKWEWSQWFYPYSDQFLSPGGVAYSSYKKWVYVADTFANRVIAFDPSVQDIYSHNFRQVQWGGKGAAPGQFQYPIGVAVDKLGNVYVADAGNDRVQKFDYAGGSPGYPRIFGPDITCPSSSIPLKRPSGVAVDSSGYIYISDTAHNRIVKLNSAGTCVMTWGTLGNGDCKVKEFNAPSGITVGGGFVTIADTANNRLMKYTTNGVCIGQTGTSGSAPGQFNKVTGVSYDGQGNIYATDTNNHTVKVYEGIWLNWLPIILKKH